MGLQIEDGVGKGTLASVSSVNRLNSSTKSNPRIYYVSRDENKAYTWLSHFNAASGNQVLYIKNTDANFDLVIDEIALGTTVANRFEFNTVTGAPTGTIISGTNMNRGSTLTPSADVRGNGSVTGLTASPFFSTRVSAGDSKIFGVNDSLILGFNEAVSVSVGVTGSVDLSIQGYFDVAR
jgi:hypothetical protein